MSLYDAETSDGDKKEDGKEEGEEEVLPTIADHCGSQRYTLKLGVRNQHLGFMIQPESSSSSDDIPEECSFGMILHDFVSSNTVDDDFAQKAVGKTYDIHGDVGSDFWKESYMYSYMY